MKKTYGRTLFEKKRAD
jgi:hypothetical protein